MNYRKFIPLIPLLSVLCLCELAVGERETLVYDFTPYFNHSNYKSFARSLQQWESNYELGMTLGQEALRYIEAKYPHPRKQDIVRIVSLEKHTVIGINYKIKLEVGLTDCPALSERMDCKLEENPRLSKLCHVNIWIRQWTDDLANFGVSCDISLEDTTDFNYHIQAQQLFSHFLTTYNPSYANDHIEMSKRFGIFKANIKKIHELNVQEKGTAKYGVTRFTDLTNEEFKSRYMGLNPSLDNGNMGPMPMAAIPNVTLPKSFDWRSFGAVTKVKDQGNCGSCWAFSVTGNIEGLWKIKSGKLLSLSEQELVDCDRLDGGCNGGLPTNAYRAIKQMGGLELERDYPYKAKGDRCVFNKSKVRVKISGGVRITSNETGMAQWLVQKGPFSIGINAEMMKYYIGGISHPADVFCDPNQLNHAVLIVGYGVKVYPEFDMRLPYWIIKNSWASNWGERGYYRIYRGFGACGLNRMASSAVI